mmetsp:Transcript_86963/g.246534  ORF Transcript_86963/g.246534 Transcript_86963/m.246534 type:complete len:555 (-) Transcript_86963:348-2012(-)
MGMPALGEAAATLEGRTNSVTSQPKFLTRADVREEIQAALAEFTENALGRELERMAAAVREAFRNALAVWEPPPEQALQRKEDFHAALDKWWAEVAQRKTIHGGGAREHLDSQSTDMASTADSTGSNTSKTTAVTWPVFSPPSSPFSLPAAASSEVEESSERDLATPSCASPLSAHGVPPPSPSSFVSPGSGGRRDWRKSFVERATKANRRVEYLYDTPCHQTHEMNAVVDEAIKAFEIGIRPHLVEDGLGGTYFVKDRAGRSIAVFKPRDEEPLAPNNPKVHAGAGRGVGLKGGVLVGEAAINEYAAYLLDQASSSVLRAGVQPTTLVSVANSVFHSAQEDRKSAFRKIKDKVGSLQLFAPHECTSEDLGWNSFPANQVHRIAVLDIRMCNADRHSGNLLVQTWLGEVTSLIPIDHGYSLPDEIGGASFEWLSWPSSKKPFSDEMREQILAIDSKAVEDMLQKRIPDMRPQCLLTLRVCTALLQRGVQAGLTAFDIGTLMTRPSCSSEPSPLEELVKHARSQSDEAAVRERVLDQLIEAKCRETAGGGTQSQS